MEVAYARNDIALGETHSIVNLYLFLIWSIWFNCIKRQCLLYRIIQNSNIQEEMTY